MNIKDKINQAINDKQTLEFIYNDNIRIVEPYIIGKTSKNKLALLSIQTGGESSSGTLPDWRMFDLDKISNVIMQARKFLSHFHVEPSSSNFDTEHMFKVLSALNIQQPLYLKLYQNFTSATIDHLNQKYWSVQALQKLLNYNKWVAFKIFVKKTQTKLGNANIHNNDNSLILSAQDCLNFVHKLNSTKPEVIFARVYFTYLL